MNHPIKKGVELELGVDGLAFGGQGLAKVKDFVIFVISSAAKNSIVLVIRGLADFSLCLK